ncbi:MAG: AAA family ATPase [Acidiphilium sp.]|nr:AAA family ATPase [Acidiphilium sp.]MDD4935320.1 AAA family ATPase [Acidiphilium sp.]
MPFRLTPDDRYYFASSEHSRALSHLLFGLAQSEGFVVITGEVGAGKTTLVERLTAQLNQATYRLASITTTQINAEDILRLIAADFGLSAAGDKASLLLRLKERWRADRVRGRRALIVVDEAQCLAPATLEELRMLSNMAERGQALVQIVLLGQPQFRDVLASPDLDQLRQRVLASYHLGPLTRNDTGAYILHRFAAAGGKAEGFFEAGALDAIYDASGGIPRRINRLCSRILLNAALEHYPVITAAIVGPIARELETDLDGRAIAATFGGSDDAGRDQGDQVVDRLFQVIKARNDP